MPGDIVDLNLTVGLENNSEPAYYIISITDDNEVFESAYYYSDGTKTGNTLNVYVFDRAKTYKQSDTTKTELTGSDLKNVGKLSAGDTNAQNLTISAKIDENFDEQGIKTTVYCKIFAIQQANISETDARAEIMGNIVGLDTSKYKYVNYLQGQRSPYILTNYYVNNNTKIKTKCQIIDRYDRFVCAARLNSTINNFSFCSTPNEGIVYYGVGYSGYKTKPIANMQNKILDIVYSLKNLSIKENGSIIVSDSYNSPLTGSYKLNIFSGMEHDRPSSHKIFYFQIFEEDTLMQNLVPCLRSSDNKPGMFDTVNSVFYVNQATGEDFLWG